MKIEHVAVWVRDIERTRGFFERYFSAAAGNRYDNAKGFSSYFLTLPGCETRIEIMQSSSISPQADASREPTVGMGHIAISVGSRETVDRLTARLLSDGHEVLSGPRTTGDGYYESCLCIFGDFLIELTP